MNKYIQICLVLLLPVFVVSCNGQSKTDSIKKSVDPSEKDSTDVDPFFSGNKTISSPNGPSSITRNIIQDRKGNIWFATWEGIIQYDGDCFINFTNKEDLGRFRVFSILEDKNGIIWFGTIGKGIYRYDPSASQKGKKSFTNISTKEGLVNDRISCIYEDKAGNIWFGTNGGISIFDGNSFHNITTKEGLTNNDINAIIEDKNGKFWIGTRGRACYYDGKTFTEITNEEGLPFMNVRSIIKDKSDNIWLGGRNGLWRYDGSSFTNIAKSFVGYIYEDRTGNIWTSSEAWPDKKEPDPRAWLLSRYDEKLLQNDEINSTQIKAEEGMLFGVLEDTDGNIWVGSLKGVCRYDGDTFNCFEQSGGINLLKAIQSNIPTETHSDEANPSEQLYNNFIGKWVSAISAKGDIDTLEFFKNGTYLLKSDLSKENGKWSISGTFHMLLSGVKYRFYFKGKNLVLEDEKGKRYEYMRPNIGITDVQAVYNSDTLISPFVRRIHQDKSGNLWLGTNGYGVARYDGDTLRYFTTSSGFEGNAVRGIAEDKKGNLWFGTERGLTKYDPTTEQKTGVTSFTNFTEKDGLINNDIWSITMDSEGIIWIGTLQGVSQFNGEVFTDFHIPESEPDPTRGVTSAKIVHSIMEDSKGKMWFGTNGGAYVYDPSAELGTGGKSLTNISEKDGLCSNSVNCILEDKDGNIWFATHHNGLCRMDGTSFTHFTKKEGVNGTEVWDLYKDKSGNIWFPVEGYGVYRYDGQSFTNFGRKDGLISNAIQCTYEDKEGRLWFGGWRGLFRYDPSARLRTGGQSFFNVSKKGPWQ